jgi:hypothetical protein
MSKDRIYDCTACAHLRTYPEPTQPFHEWQCAPYGWSVGGSVMNCGSFKRRAQGECPPKADTSAFMWRAPAKDQAA